MERGCVLLYVNCARTCQNLEARYFKTDSEEKEKQYLG